MAEVQGASSASVQTTTGSNSSEAYQGGSQSGSSIETNNSPVNQTPLEKALGGSTTEQRLKSIQTPIDRLRDQGDQNSTDMAGESAVIARAAQSGADIGQHENPIRVINEQLTQDAATALMRKDLPPATAQQVKNVIEQLGDGIRADKVATGINGQFAQNVGHLAHADPSSAEFKGALAQLTRTAEIASQRTLAPGTKIAFDPEAGQEGVTKLAKLPQLDVAKVDADVYYRSADGTLHLDSSKAAPNTLATEIRDATKKDAQMNRQQQWRQNGTAESPRQLGLYVLEEGTSRTGTGNLLNPANLNKLSNVVGDPNARVVMVGDRAYSVNDLKQMSDDRAAAAEPSVAPKREAWLAAGKSLDGFESRQYGPELKAYFEKNNLTSFDEISRQMGKSYGVPRETLKPLGTPQLPSLKQGGAFGAATSVAITIFSVAKDGNLTLNDVGEITKSTAKGGAIGVVAAKGEQVVTPLVDRAIGNAVQRKATEIAANNLGQNAMRATANGLATRTMVSRLGGGTIVGAAISTGISAYENRDGLAKGDSKAIGNVTADTAVGAASVASAMAVGAAVGSVVPIAGTAVGAIVGLAVGVGVAYGAQISGARDAIANGVSEGIDTIKSWF